VLAVVIGLVVVFFVTTDFITDLWWFQSVDYRKVFTTS